MKKSVKNEEFVKTIVTNEEIDPKVVMDLSIFILEDGTIFCPATNTYWKNSWVRMNRGC